MLRLYLTRSLAHDPDARVGWLAAEFADACVANNAEIIHRGVKNAGDRVRHER
jgi:hypothetical protein